MFGKKYVSVELEKENKYEVSGKNLKDFLDMIDSGEINEAENILLRPGAGNQHLHWYFNFTGCIVETALKSLRLSCGSELTRQGISLP